MAYPALVVTKTNC